MMNKKGQLLEKPFMFLFITIVGALVFIFGIYLVKSLMQTSDCAQVGLFVNDLRKNVDRYYNFDFGSSTKISLRLPNSIEYVCFKNNNEDLDKAKLDKIDQNLFTILDNSKDNVIFTPINKCDKTFFKVDKIIIKNNPLCILNTGIVKIGLENQGDFVEITKA